MADVACDFCDQAWHYQPGEVPLPRVMPRTLRGPAHETTAVVDFVRQKIPVLRNIFPRDQKWKKSEFVSVLAVTLVKTISMSAEP